MKKLMIAVAAITVSVIANAANCNWSSYAMTADMMGSLDGGSYWLVAMGSDSDVSGFKVYSDGTYDFGAHTVAKNGTIGTMGAVGDTIAGLTSADNNSYYALVVWDGAAEGFYGSAVGQISGIVDNPPTDASAIGFDNSGLGYGITLANTAVEAVPEPTSGLLLLLGVAGLALRRRRA